MNHSLVILLSLRIVVRMRCVSRHQPHHVHICSSPVVSLLLPHHYLNENPSLSEILDQHIIIEYLYQYLTSL